MPLSIASPEAIFSVFFIKSYTKDTLCVSCVYNLLVLDPFTFCQLPPTSIVCCIHSMRGRSPEAGQIDLLPSIPCHQSSAMRSSTSLYPSEPYVRHLLILLIVAVDAFVASSISLYVFCSDRSFATCIL